MGPVQENAGHTGVSEILPRACGSIIEGPVNDTPFQTPAGCGAECVFVGRTRTEAHTEHGALVALVYEAYRPMAQQMLDRLAHQAVEKFDCRAVEVRHSVGRVPVGRPSVVVRVASPHRDAAFAACRWLIDTLKQDLPIWKQEEWEQGRTYARGVRPISPAASISTPPETHTAPGPGLRGQ